MSVAGSHLSASSQDPSESQKDVYEVESVVDSRLGDENQVEYHIKWRGYGPDFDTWEPANNLLHGCQDLIQQFEVQQREHTRTLVYEIEGDDDEDHNMGTSGEMPPALGTADNSNSNKRQLPNLTLFSVPTDSTPSNQGLFKSLAVSKQSGRETSALEKITTHITTDEPSPSHATEVVLKPEQHAVTENGNQRTGAHANKDDAEYSAQNDESDHKEHNDSHDSLVSSSDDTKRRALLRDTFWHDLQRNKVTFDWEKYGDDVDGRRRSTRNVSKPTAEPVAKAPVTRFRKSRSKRTSGTSTPLSERPTSPVSTTSSTGNSRGSRSSRGRGRGKAQVVESSSSDEEMDLQNDLSTKRTTPGGSIPSRRGSLGRGKPRGRGRGRPRGRGRGSVAQVSTNTAEDNHLLSSSDKDESDTEKRDENKDSESVDKETDTKTSSKPKQKRKLVLSSDNDETSTGTETIVRRSPRKPKQQKVNDISETINDVLQNDANVTKKPPISNNQPSSASRIDDIIEAVILEGKSKTFSKTVDSDIFTSLIEEKVSLDNLTSKPTVQEDGAQKVGDSQLCQSDIQVPESDDQSGVMSLNLSLETGSDIIDERDETLDDFVAGPPKIEKEVAAVQIDKQQDEVQVVESGEGKGLDQLPELKHFDSPATATETAVVSVAHSLLTDNTVAVKPLSADKTADETAVASEADLLSTDKKSVVAAQSADKKSIETPKQPPTPDTPTSNRHISEPVEPTSPPIPRPECDKNLPMPVDAKLEMGEFIKAEMRFYQRENGRSVPHEDFLFACLNSKLDIVRSAALYKNKNQTSCYIDAESPDAAGNSILMQVASKPCDPSHQADDIMEYLVLQLKADVNRRNIQGQTALHLAVDKVQLCKVNKLLSFHASPNLADAEGFTPLMLAAKKNCSNIVIRLLEHGADYMASTKVPVVNSPARGVNMDKTKVVMEEHTALEIAKENGSRGCIQFLEEHKKRVKSASDSAMSAVLRDIRTKRQICPQHCYSLSEADRFRVWFNFEPVPLPNTRYGYIVMCSLARLHAQQVYVRLWGPCPVEGVEVNGVTQRPLQEEGKFVFTCHPLKMGLNEVTVTCNPNCRDSQLKLLIQVLLVQLKQPPVAYSAGRFIEATSSSQNRVWTGVY